MSANRTRVLPLLELLSSLPKTDKVCVIAIDGRAASGKTTLAAHLAAILGAGIVHMDDFFLPAQLRTKERLSSPGGNVHYERFAAEILPCLSSSGAFSYGIFDCAKMALGGERAVAASRYRVVEGAYACHPAFGNYMDIRVFSNIDTEEQIKRIRARNGEAAKVFASRWIPMEEKYFAAFGIKEKADFVL
jgi:uridine kinase